MGHYVYKKIKKGNKMKEFKGLKHGDEMED